MSHGLGRRLKEFRLDRGWTQVRLAAYLGLSWMTVSRLERGGKCMDLTRRKIEKRLAEAEVAA